MDVQVQIGGWEHGCCGEAIARGELVDLGCVHVTDGDARVGLVETHHGVEPDLRVQGRVVDIEVVRGPGRAEPVDRLPSGRALSGNDPHDDGHLERPVSGEYVADGLDFVLTIRTS